MKLRGTMNADQIKMTYGFDWITAGRGNDTIFLFNALSSTVNGGKGHDTFEFRVFEDETYSITRQGEDTIITIDNAGNHQEIILKDFEDVVVHELNF